MDRIQIVTNGIVVQTFDTKNQEFINQSFYGDDTEYEDIDGNPISFEELPKEIRDALDNTYLPTNLVQPKEIYINKNKIASLSEQIQSDLLTLMSSIFAAGTENYEEDKAAEAACQIVVDKITDFLGE
jgi:hypothetical protein